MSKKYSEDLKKEVVNEYLIGGKKTLETAKAYNVLSSTVLD